MTTALNPTQNVVSATESGWLEQTIRKRRFTQDGSDALENHLTRVCEKVSAGVQCLIPRHKLEALLLGGGYGRGEGGVLKAKNGDQPYNDLEFYVFVRGHRLWNERKFSAALRKLGEQLSPEAGLHVEFKVDSLVHLRCRPVTMFSYDLVSAHRVLPGSSIPLLGCEHHLDAKQIPLAEATRLLMNRCSGLLFAREKLTHEPFSADDADFVIRNIAKAQLAFGDVVLTVFGEYHWSCRERHKRLQKLSPPEILPWLEDVRRHHAVGMEFKLHPYRSLESRAVLEARHAEITSFALPLWLWLEKRRLGCHFESALDYARSPALKWPTPNSGRNFLSNLRVFGPAALFQINACRHPGERILNILALLLWEAHSAKSGWRQQLHCAATPPGADIRRKITEYQTFWSKLN